MIVAFVSGNCSIGKTTVACNLAYLLKDTFDVSFFDCDIEKTDATVFLPSKWIEEKEIVISVPKIDRSQCNHCLNCVRICQFGVFLDFKNTIITLPERCAGCGYCSSFCTRHAIDYKPFVLGTIKKGSYKNLTVIESRINSTAVKADSLLFNTHSLLNPLGLNVVDCAPLISEYHFCSALDPDFFVIVTNGSFVETKNFLAIVQQIQEMNRPFGIVINKAKTEKSFIEDYCQNNNLPILGILPFEEDVVSGKTSAYKLVTYSDKWQALYKNLWQRILEEVSQ